MLIQGGKKDFRFFIRMSEDANKLTVRTDNALTIADLLMVKSIVGTRNSIQKLLKKQKYVAMRYQRE